MSQEPPPPAAIAIGLASAIPGLFGFFCPSPTDVNTKSPHIVQQQQAKAIGASLALGAAGSWACRAPWPFVMAIIIVGLLMWEYTTHGARKDPDV